MKLEYVKGIMDDKLEDLVAAVQLIKKYSGVKCTEWTENPIVDVMSGKRVGATIHKFTLQGNFIQIQRAKQFIKDVIPGEKPNKELTRIIKKQMGL